MDVQPLALSLGAVHPFGFFRDEATAIDRAPDGVEVSAATEDTYSATTTYGQNASVTGLVPDAATLEHAAYTLADGARVEVDFSAVQRSTQNPATNGTEVSNAEQATATATVTNGVAGTTYIPEIVQSLPIQTLAGASGGPTVVTDSTGYQLVGVLAVTTSTIKFGPGVKPFPPPPSVDASA